MSVVEAPVVTRVEISPDALQAPFESAVAVVDGSIWMVLEGRDYQLVRVDIASDQVVAAVHVDPSALIAGDGRLWTMSPVDVAPGPPRRTLSYVDVDTNAVVGTRYPEIWAAGLGSLWGISLDKGLVQVEPDTGFVATTWPTLRGYEGTLQAACDRVWIEDEDERVSAFDPVAGVVGTPIDSFELGFGRIHETMSGCWVIRGSPGQFPDYPFGFLAQVDSTGVVRQSVALWDRLHIAGDTFWASRTDGEIWRIDPMTGQQLGHRWQLPVEDLPTNPKLAGWRLMSAEGQLYLLTAKSLVHLDIPTE